jgi:hypothetical protein
MKRRNISKLIVSRSHLSDTHTRLCITCDPKEAKNIKESVMKPCSVTHTPYQLCVTKEVEAKVTAFGFGALGKDREESLFGPHTRVFRRDPPLLLLSGG